MMESLAELTQYIRDTIPQSKQITHLKPIDEADAVTFHWQGRDFVVKRSLHVLEMKEGKKVFITGASMLMQQVLMHRTRNEQVLEGIIKAIAESEDLIFSKHRSQAGLKLLEAAKASLSRLAGKGRRATQLH